MILDSRYYLSGELTASPEEIQLQRNMEKFINEDRYVLERTEEYGGFYEPYAEVGIVSIASSNRNSEGKPLLNVTTMFRGRKEIVFQSFDMYEVISYLARYNLLPICEHYFNSWTLHLGESW